ncbi:hypothetical protein WR25_21873 [Diploscapter pachys]|uniref:Receptor L-domain domain-containing protein n=1 Tax=Diploscapter pachys TaxID=2018661 RepID=A0A2A2M0E7_9BILA|nr:hypothetical protein WR25_21873 [Diploscapter pachys]
MSNFLLILLILPNLQISIAERNCKLEDGDPLEKLEKDCSTIEGNIFINKDTPLDETTLKQILGSVLKVDGSVIIENTKLRTITFFEKLEVISCKKPYAERYPVALFVGNNKEAVEFSMPALRSVIIEPNVEGLNSTILFGYNPNLCLTESQLFFFYGMLAQIINTTVCNPSKIYCGIMPVSNSPGVFHCSNLPSGCQILMNPLELNGDECTDALNEKLSAIEFIPVYVAINSTKFVNIVLSNLAEISGSTGIKNPALNIYDNAELQSINLTKLHKISYFPPAFRLKTAIIIQNNTNLTLTQELCTQLNMVSRASEIGQLYKDNLKNCFRNETGPDFTAVPHYYISLHNFVLRQHFCDVFGNRSRSSVAYLYEFPQVIPISNALTSMFFVALTLLVIPEYRNTLLYCCLDTESDDNDDKNLDPIISSPTSSAKSSVSSIESRLPIKLALEQSDSNELVVYHPHKSEAARENPNFVMISNEEVHNIMNRIKELQKQQQVTYLCSNYTPIIFVTSKEMINGNSDTTTNPFYVTSPRP